MFTCIAVIWSSPIQLCVRIMLAWLKIAAHGASEVASVMPSQLRNEWVLVPDACKPIELNSLHSGLPPILLSDDFSWARGPHESCNYVLPAKNLIAGGYPGDKSEPGHTKKIKDCLNAGVDCFLCLQGSDELTKRFTSYVRIAKELYAASGCSSGQRASSIEFLHCPMPDWGVIDYGKLM